MPDELPVAPAGEESRSSTSTFAPDSRAASAASAPAAPAPMTMTGTDVANEGRDPRMTAMGSVGGELRLDPAGRRQRSRVIAGPGHDLQAERQSALAVRHGSRQRDANLR